MAIKDLFTQELKVVNVGLSSFKDNLDRVNTKAVQVEWRPPADVDQGVLDTLKANMPEIENANAEAVKKILASRPFLVGLDTAINVIPGMKKNLILHAGPPITWDRMCGPMRGAIMGALIYEGLAKTPEEAEKLAVSGFFALPYRFFAKEKICCSFMGVGGEQ